MIPPRPSYSYCIFEAGWWQEGWGHGCLQQWSPTAIKYLPEHAKPRKLPPSIPVERGQHCTWREAPPQLRVLLGPPHKDSHTPQPPPPSPPKADPAHGQFQQLEGGQVSTQPTDCMTCLEVNRKQQIHQEGTNVSIAAGRQIHRGAHLVLGATRVSQEVGRWLLRALRHRAQNIQYSLCSKQAATESKPLHFKGAFRPWAVVGIGTILQRGKVLLLREQVLPSSLRDSSIQSFQGLGPLHLSTHSLNFQICIAEHIAGQAFFQIYKELFKSESLYFITPL